MAKINVAPGFAIKNLSLSIGADTFEAAVTDFNWSNATGAIEFRGGTPDAVFTDQSSPVFTANLTAAQDWHTATSLCNYLLDNAGKTAAVVYKPDATKPVRFAADIVLAAPMIGGPVNGYPMFTVAMGSTKPVRTFVAVP